MEIINEIKNNINFQNEQLTKSKINEFPNNAFNKLKELQNSLKKESTLKNLCKKIIYL